MSREIPPASSPSANRARDESERRRGDGARAGRVRAIPPEDLLFHSGMRRRLTRAIGSLKAEVRGITLIAGYPEYDGDATSINSALVLRDGAVLANHRKANLPNYRVFDEKRYFTPGTETYGGGSSTASKREFSFARISGPLSPRASHAARWRRAAAGHQRLPLRGQQAGSA
jgi:predicted amidohydrolase